MPVKQGQPAGPLDGHLAQPMAATIPETEMAIDPEQRFPATLLVRPYGADPDFPQSVRAAVHQASYRKIDIRLSTPTKSHSIFDLPIVWPKKPGRDGCRESD